MNFKGNIIDTTEYLIIAHCFIIFLLIGIIHLILQFLIKYILYNNFVIILFYIYFLISDIGMKVDIKHKNAKIINPNHGTAYQYNVTLSKDQIQYCKLIEVLIPKVLTLFK